jgi:hypothetical protein
MTNAERMKANRDAEKAKREANNLKRLGDTQRIRNKESNLPEIVKLFHHLS